MSVASTTPADGGLSASAAEKKRQFMLSRAARLRDPKVRHMGIDKAALDEQVREKEALRTLEKERAAFFDRQHLLIAEHAQTLQDQVDAIRANREREMVAFRKAFQQPHMRREWDLEDPARFKMELPARVSDDDPRCGPSSMQRFEGEDLDFPSRRAAQHRQQQRWAQQQTEEKLARKWMEEAANRQFDDRLEETNYRTYEVERSIAEQRNAALRNTAEFNKALAEQKKQEALRDAAEETRLKKMEIANMLNSDFLNERDPARGTLLGGSVKSERFKGMTADQLHLLHTQQAEQRDDMRRRRLLELEEERQWAQKEQMQLRMGDALERQRARERRLELERLSNVHQSQTLNARERKRSLDEAFQNEVTDDYFKHWDLCL